MINKDAKAYIVRIKYNSGKTLDKMYPVNNDEEFQSLADRLHVFGVQDNVVEVQLLRTRLPNKFADPDRIKYRDPDHQPRPKFLLDMHSSGAFMTPSERELD